MEQVLTWSAAAQWKTMYKLCSFVLLSSSSSFLQRNCDYLTLLGNDYALTLYLDKNQMGLLVTDATEHVTNSIKADFFGTHVTSKNLWPPPLLDLMCPHCYIWVYLKQFIQEHQQNIGKFIATVYWQCFVICLQML